MITTFPIVSGAFAIESHLCAVKADFVPSGFPVTNFTFLSNEIFEVKRDTFCTLLVSKADSNKYL